MRRVWFSATLLIGVALPAQAGPLTISNITGSWLNIATCLGGDPDPFHCTPPPNPDPANIPANNNPENTDGAIVTTANVAGQGTDQIRWGGAQDYILQVTDAPKQHLSGYNFTPSANPVVTVNPGDSAPLIYLGLFQHVNVTIDDAPNIVRYDLNIATNGLPAGLALQLVFDHNETDNYCGAPCSDDLVTVAPMLSAQPFFQGTDKYFFELLGLSIDSGNSFVTTFRSPEGTTNGGNLYGRITSAPVTTTAVPEPATMALLGSGLAAVAAHRRRRRDTSARP